MTFSVVAYCPHTGQFGVGAATAMPAVGKLLSHASPRAGAVATQATVNPYLGYDGIRLLEHGYRAQQALDLLIRQDPHPELRQLGLIDRHGKTATWTGSEAPYWAGELHGKYFCTQGNRLAGPQVLDAVAEVMQREMDCELAERLLLAVEAGDAQGGDTKGERSANILVIDSEEYPLWDVRVDDHDHPVLELRRLFGVFREDFLPHLKKMPTRREFPQPIDG